MNSVKEQGQILIKSYTQTELLFKICVKVGIWLIIHVPWHP